MISKEKFNTLGYTSGNADLQGNYREIIRYFR